jgi:hypothetical protein
MSGSSYPTLSMVIPLYNALIDHTEDHAFNDNEESLIKTAATMCRSKLLEYYNKTNNACTIVTILDPRLKMDYYNDDTWNDDQRKEIREKLIFFIL